RLVEWWIEQWQDLRTSCDEGRPNGVHRPFGEALRNRAGEHRPRLRGRIDLTLVVLRRAQRGAVVIVAAPVPFAVPRQLELRSEPAGRFPIARCRRAIVARVAQGREAGEDAVEKKPDPGAFAASGLSHAVHAVVPITGTKEREAVRPGGHAFLDRADPMVAQR